jgi:hypothetical protein
VKFKEPYPIRECVMLRAAFDKIEAMLGESCAKELQKIPLPDNTVGRRISDI